MLSEIELYLNVPDIKVYDIYGERPKSEHRIIRWLMANCRDYIELTLADRERGIWLEQANLYHMQKRDSHIQQ